MTSSGDGGTSAGGVGNGGGAAGGASSLPETGEAGGPAVPTTPIAAFPSPVLPVPRNCVPDVDFADATSCTRNVACDGYDFVDVNCAEMPSGAWSCYCYTLNASYIVDATGASGAAACEAAGEFCGSGSRPADGGADSCEVELQGASGSFCQLQQHCWRPLDQGGGVAVGFARSVLVTCNGPSSDAVSCDCIDGDVVHESFEASSTGDEDLCQSVMDLCLAEGTAFDAPSTCAEEMLSSEIEKCAITRECTQPSGVDDISAVGLESTACQRAEDGTALCDCETWQYNLRFAIADPASPGDRCTEAVDVCERAFDLGLVSEPSCGELQDQLANDVDCSGTFRCGQAALLGSQDVTVYGDVEVLCSEGDAGWRCSCYAPSETVDLDVQPSAELGSACVSAAEQCPSLLDTPVGLTLKVSSSGFPL